MAKQFIIMKDSHWGGHSLPCASFDKLDDAASHVNKLQKGTMDCYDIVDTDTLKIVDNGEKCPIREKERLDIERMEARKKVADNNK